MKCSVCAREVPAEDYAAHLSTEHGVTDDPGAVLLQHLADSFPDWDMRNAAFDEVVPVDEEPSVEPTEEVEPQPEPEQEPEPEPEPAAVHDAWTTTEDD